MHFLAALCTHLGTCTSLFFHPSLYVSQTNILFSSLALMAVFLMPLDSFIIAPHNLAVFAMSVGDGSVPLLQSSSTAGCEGSP